MELIGKILDFERNFDRKASELHQSIGIPIGNLTSQFFANIYLNGMDHFIKEELRCWYYLRYMDDFMVFHSKKEFLWQVKGAIVDYLKGLSLKLHDNKCRIYKTDQGVPFLGLIVFPQKRRSYREVCICGFGNMRCGVCFY